MGSAFFKYNVGDLLGDLLFTALSRETAKRSTDSETCAASERKALLGSALHGLRYLFVLLGAFWVLLGAFWVPLGLSWGGLGALLGALGRSWGALQALMERSWDALGALRGVLGAPRAILARFWTLQEWILGPLDVDFGASASWFAKRSGIDFANTTQERRERLATTMQQHPDWGVHYALLESSYYIISNYK